MPALLPSPYRTQMPPAGAQIDWSVASQLGITNLWVANAAGGGIISDLITGRIATLVGTAKYDAAPGPGMGIRTNADYVSLGNVLIPASHSLFIYFTPYSKAEVASRAGIFVKGFWGGDGLGDTRIYSNVRYDFQCDGGEAIDPGAIVLGQTEFLVGTYDQPGARLRLYRKGALVAEVTGSTTFSNNARNMVIGGYTNAETTVHYDLSVYIAGVSNRALTGSEARALTAEPFAMLRGPDVWRRYL